MKATQQEQDHVDRNKATTRAARAAPLYIHDKNDMMVACDLQKMERSDGHVVFSEEEIDVLNSIKDMV